MRLARVWRATRSSARCTGEDTVARELEHPSLTAELPCELIALACRRRVVPELRRSHRPVPLIEAYEPMLLPGHTDTADIEPLAAHGIAHRDAKRVDPPLRVLLARPVVAFDQLMRRTTDSDNLARV